MQTLTITPFAGLQFLALCEGFNGGLLPTYEAIWLTLNTPVSRCKGRKGRVL